jgi:hypothetical protein
VSNFEERGHSVACSKQISSVGGKPDSLRTMADEDLSSYNDHEREYLALTSQIPTRLTAVNEYERDAGESIVLSPLPGAVPCFPCLCNLLASLLFPLGCAQTKQMPKSRALRRISGRQRRR